MFFSAIFIFIMNQSLLFGDEGPKTKKSILINGGYSETSNYSAHEHEIASFYHYLFDKKSTILNADGKENKVIQILKDGSFKRDQRGFLILGDSLFQTVHPRASIQNLKKELLKLKKNPVEQLTLVYSDHGTQNGVSLWGGDQLNARDVSGLYDKVSNKTQIKSIHLHCYPGALVVDPKRTVPENIKQLPKFLRKHYRMNRCAVAMGSHDETLTYYSWEKPFNKSSWSQLFQKRPKISLDEFKSHFMQNEDLNESARLTSDYFLEDVAKTFCHQIKNVGLEEFQQSVLKYCDDNVSNNPLQVSLLTNLTQTLVESLCGGKLLQSIADSSQSIKDYNDLQKEFTQLKNDMAKKFLQEKHPEVYRRYQSRLHEIEILQASYIASGTNIPDHILAKLEKMNKEIPAKFNLAIKSVTDTDSFDEYLNNLDLNWFAKRKDDYPLFYEVYSTVAKKNPSMKPAQFNDVIYSYKNSSKLKRKKLIKKFDQKKREILHSLLGYPGFANIKEKYDSIRKCETSPVN